MENEILINLRETYILRISPFVARVIDCVAEFLKKHHNFFDKIDMKLQHGQILRKSKSSPTGCMNHQCHSL